MPPGPRAALGNEDFFYMMKTLTKFILSSLLLTSLSGLGLAKPMPHVPADHFVVPEGFEVTLWASSPLFYNPTNMDVDAEGRIWVAEGRNYRMYRNESKGFSAETKGDRIMVLTDSNGDGKADKSHVFVQDPELIAPLGVAVIDNQVVVSQPPNLLVYTDVNRDAVFDPKVDKKEALLTGFGGQDHDHSLHAVTTGPSGQWYFNAGNAGSHIVTDKDGWTLRVGSVYKGGAPSVTDEGPNQGGKPGLKSDDGHIYVGAVALRMNPDGTGLRPIGHNMRNSYEETVNSFGDVYQNDNDDPPACRTTWLMEYGNLGFASDDGARKWQTERRPGQAAPIAEWRQEDPGTIPAGDVYGNGSPTGICFYENGALGEDYRGLLLSGEAARNVIFGYLPKPDGAGFTMDRFDFFRSKRADEFPEGQGDKASLATQFRPSDVCVGPDGAIYVADWFDPGVGGHSMRDLDHAAAIYRITRKGDNPRPAKYDINTEAGQIASLKSPANNVRDAGFTRLKAAGEKSLPAVKALLDDPNEYIQARAVWLLAQLGDKGIAEVEKVLADDNPQMRIAAFRALRFVDHKLLEHAVALAKDPSIAVRREVALALRNLSLEDTQDIILTLASQYKGEDRWYLEAIGTACANKEAAIYSILDKELGNEDPIKWSQAFAKLAWRLHPAASVDGFKARALSVKIPLADRKDALTALGFIPDEAAAMAMVAVAESGPDDTKSLAQWWLQNRSEHVWKSYASQMKGLNKKPNALKANQDYKVPVDGPEITKLDVQEVVALKGDVARGQMNIARCYMCHQVNGTGVDFGPALDQWGLGRSVEAIATAIIHPNEGIAHGFEGTEYVTKDGHTLQGFTLFAGGSVILKVMGGGEVSFSRNLVESSEPLEKSLMMSAGQLGLTNQDVADIAAYLKAGAPVDPKAVPVSTTAPPAAKEVKPKAKPQVQPNKPQQAKKKQGRANSDDPLINPFANPSDDPALPRVLIIGDSISIGYTTMLRKNLVDKANVHRVDGNCRWSAYGDENIEQWLGEGDWDLIHFNFGLWDWYGWSQDAKSTPESYAKSLESIVAKMKANTSKANGGKGAKLIFATTTPPCSGPEKKVKIIVSDERAKEFRDAALAVMKKHGVAINDLYGLIDKKRVQYLQGPDNVHYHNDGKALQAKQVAEVIAAALPATPSATKSISGDVKPISTTVVKPATKKPVKFDLNDRKAGLTYENAPKIVWGDTTGKKRILFIAGSTTHRHGIHEYKAGSLLLAKALNESGLPVVAKVHWFNWPEDESCLEGVDTIIVYADGGGDYGEKYAVLDEKYKQGTALMFMHYGVHPTKEVGEKYYNKWMGGYFADAFSVNPSWIADMVPKDGHPVARGLSGSIKAFDEFYWNLNFAKDCKDCYPLATGIPTPENMVTYGSSKFWNKDAADKLGTPQSLLWCRDPADAPRGAGFVGGHFHRNWAIDDYRKLILNTIAWVTKVEVPKDGITSEAVTQEILNQNLNRPEWPEPVELPTPDLLTQPGGKVPELGPDGRAMQKKRKPAKKK